MKYVDCDLFIVEKVKYITKVTCVFATLSFGIHSTAVPGPVKFEYKI